MSDRTQAKYDVKKVEAVILEAAVELHPRHQPTPELVRSIVANNDDKREVETAEQAIRNLREFGLFDVGDDEVVKPTPAALRAVGLLT